MIFICGASINNGYVICILEGAAEEAIISLLFKNNRLCFKENDHFNEENLIRSFTRKRNGTKFANEYLNQDYGEVKLHTIRTLDSKVENFKLPKIHKLKVKAGDIIIHDILTRPEIEILSIIDKGKYGNYRINIMN